MKYEVRLKPCSHPCETCGREVPPNGAPNYLYQTGHHWEVFCLGCIQFQISEDNRVMGEQRFMLVIDEIADEPKREQEQQQPEPHPEFGTPPAKHSEYKPGDTVRYQTGNQEQTGEVLHVTDGAGGQLVIVENAAQGFPDVVPTRELLE